jgi:hypothetical protein
MIAGEPVEIAEETGEKRATRQVLLSAVEVNIFALCVGRDEGNFWAVQARPRFAFDQRQLQSQRFCNRFARVG